MHHIFPQSPKGQTKKQKEWSKTPHKLQTDLETKKLTSLSGAHSSSLQSESSESALTVNKPNLLLLVFGCFKENLLEEKAQVLAAKVA